jgi:hypothetical protein
LKGDWGMSFDKEFDQNMKHLMRLLKRIMRQYAAEGKNPVEMMEILKAMKDKSPEVNIFFVNMLPLSPEEFEELEDVFEGGVMSEHYKTGELKCELNAEDEEFLKRHGIRF